MKIYSTLNPRPVHISENSGEDIVIPDDSLSVIEIIARYQRGLPTDIHERPVMYDDDDLDIEDFSVDPLNEFNDLTDVYEMSRELFENEETTNEDPKQDLSDKTSSDSTPITNESTPNT